MLNNITTRSYNSSPVGSAMGVEVRTEVEVRLLFFLPVENKVLRMIKLFCRVQACSPLFGFVVDEPRAPSTRCQNLNVH